MPLDRWKRQVILVLLSTVVPALLLLAVEFGLRLAGSGYPSSFLIPAANNGGLQTNRRFGWRFFPRAVARTPVPALLDRPKPPGARRIFILGESAAMGVPDPAFSFGRILGAMLSARHPGTRFEVVNAAMTAINSHAILPIARDCARAEPDLFILYIGNNEVVGPHGSGSVFGRTSPPLPLLRAGIWFRGARIGQLGERMLSSLRPSEARIGEWGGMAMFLGRTVAASDPRMRKVYSDFERNLADICRVARRSGAAVVLSTMAVNLTGCAPFASLHRAGLSPADLKRWEELYRSGAELADRGNCAAALDRLNEAAALDLDFAELHFRRARCFQAVGKTLEAAISYSLAADLDALRFRADTRINRIIRAVAETGGAHLVDAELAFAGRTGLFHEHVHFTLEGAYHLASILLPAVEEQLFPGAESRPVPLAEVAGRLCYTPWDEYRIAADMAEAMERPPFTNQMDFAEGQTRRRRELASLQQRGASAEAMLRARGAYEQALRIAPGDLHLRENFAELLRRQRDYRAAAAQFRALLERLPDVVVWRTGLAEVLSESGSLEEAVSELRGAIALDGANAPAWQSLGTALARLGRTRDALAACEEALRLRPGFAEALNGRGVALLKLGRVEDALASLSAAVRSRPRYAEAHNNLGLALAARGRIAEAIREYDTAGQIDPSFAGAHYNRAGALAATGRLDEAVAACREAVRLRPEWSEARYDLGVLLARRGDLPAAIEQYNEALRLRPDYPEAENNLGTALARSGRLPQAVPHFRRALELKPDYPEARRNLALALSGLKTVR